MTSPSRDILAQQYLSLGTLYFIRRRVADALQLLELSKSLNPDNARTRYLLGRIYLHNQKPESALEEFEKTRELDPFFEDIHRALANLYLEMRRYEDAVLSYMDAYVLSGGVHAARNSFYQRQIRAAFQVLSQDDSEEEYRRLFEQRRKHYLQLAMQLAESDTELQLKHDPPQDEMLFQDVRASDVSDASPIVSASELRKFDLLKELSAIRLQAIVNITEPHSFDEQEVIFTEDKQTAAIYLIDHGSVRIVKMTPFGEQLLASVSAGEHFGEIDFIDSLRWSADAVANTPTRLFAISKARLEELFLTDKHIAVHFYRHFWKTLSRRIRNANELLKTFFNVSPGTPDVRRSAETASGKATTVDLENKVSVLKERGLSSEELQLLAAFSKEQFFKADETIFLEGQAADRLYIILDGAVRISKYIPGAGEEALAILGKGEFFGEMALIDGSPRSADARAHGDVTVLPIESSLLQNLLSRDVETSYEFLYILCKILSRRLREINLKIYHWRMMSGGF